MKVRGHYNGNVVVLDEPAPVDKEAAVEVLFPETAHPKMGSGLPLIPQRTPAECRERAERLRAMFEEWAAEPPSDELYTWDELKEALERNRQESGESRKPLDG